MSLPSQAIFAYEDGTEVKHFVNIGLFVRERLIPDLVKECNVPENWITVKVYSETYTKEDLEKISKKVYPRPKLFEGCFFKRY